LVILGIDPGTAICGYGVIADDGGGRLSARTYGSIKTEPSSSAPERLLLVFRNLGDIIDTFHPDLISIEQLFFNRNVSTAMSVGQARGVALLACALRGLPVMEFTPLVVKQTVTGYGRADKRQVQFMVKTLLNMDRIPSPDDAADALAVAICCAHHKDHLQLLSRMEGKE
jgi:crossover junction endodeoxyribonuclease RuvC